MTDRDALKRVAIIGSGATAKLFAVSLSNLVQVIMYASSQSFPLQREKEFIVKGSISKSARIEVRDSASSLNIEAEPTAYFLCVKAFEVETILKRLRSVVGSPHVICLFQNGLGVADLARANVAQGISWLRGMLRLGVRSLSPLEVECTGVDSITLVPGAASMQASAQKVGLLLDQAGFPIHYEKDLQRAEWQKCLVNIITNSIGTILDCQNGAILEDGELIRIARIILQEAVQVAQAEGVAFSASDIEGVFTTIKKVAGNINSTLVDVRAGKLTETDFLLGEVVARARKQRLPLPYSELILTLLRNRERIVRKRI